MNPEELHSYRYWLVQKLAQIRMQLPENNLADDYDERLVGQETAYVNCIDELDERIRTAQK